MALDISDYSFAGKDKPYSLHFYSTIEFIDDL